MKKTISIIIVMLMLLTVMPMLTQNVSAGTSVDWVEATPSANWSTRISHTSVVYDNKMWVMGGRGDSTTNDVWYTTDGVNWTQATGSANWSARFGLTSLIYDNKMWVIGGYNYVSKSLNDVWYTTDGVNWTQATASANWTSRAWHTSFVFDNKMWIIGGYNRVGDIDTWLNDTWYSTDGINWTQATANAEWHGRSNFGSIVYDDKMWVMGGYWTIVGVGLYNCNDVWYSTDGTNWTEATTNANWTDRYYLASVVFDDKMWVIGGYDGVGSYFYNDVWYSTDGINWIETSKATAYERVGHSSIIYDNKMWLMGGYDGGYHLGYLNDVWYSTYLSHAPVISNNNPTEGAYVSIQPTCSVDVNDVDRDYMNVSFYENTTGDWILRQTNATILDGTYYWNYTQADSYSTRYWWKVVVDDGALNSTQIFSFYTFASVVYVDTAYDEYTPGWDYDHFSSVDDAINGVMEGGKIIINNGTFTDTPYEIDKSVFIEGTNLSNVTISCDEGWTQATPSANWSGRVGFGSCIYDNKMWVIGGYSSDYFNDVWYSTNGVNWTMATEHANWTGRYGFSCVVYDNKMWIMGGMNWGLGGYLNDVWYSTDGINWTQATANAGWFGRTRFTITVYDNKMWVMGGDYLGAGPTYANDVWYSTNGVNWTQATVSANWIGRTDSSSFVYENKMWIMGGYDMSGHGHYGYLTDIWYSTDGTNWTEATSDINTSSVYFSTTIYDNKIWVMGGMSYDTGAYLNNLWYSTDGTNWTETLQSSLHQVSWTGRCSAGILVYDDKIWILSGYNGANLYDVWYQSAQNGFEITVSDVTVANCTFVNADGTAGILVNNTENVTITSCEFYNCSTGVYFDDVTDSFVYYNNFINVSSFDNDSGLTNAWDDGAKYGNYWSVYDEPSEGAWDNNSNYVADSPYILAGVGSQDRYPLMDPWTGSQPPFPPWDITQDGVVNYLDISALVSHYGQSGIPGWIPEDINDDGFVNYLDVSSLVSHYGEYY